MPDGGLAPLRALLPDGGVALSGLRLALFYRCCRPDKRSAIRHVFGSQGRTSHPLYCRMAALPYPPYGIAVIHYPARFCRPDKRSAIRHVFGSQGRAPCPLYCRMAALPYPAYAIAVMHHPARFCRPDKRSAIRHVLRARVEHPARFLPDGGVALSGLRDRSHASPGTVL